MGGRIPPGQVLTSGWPVPHAGSIPTDPTSDYWSLSVPREVEWPRTYAHRDLLALPRKELECDIHCVTQWTKLGVQRKGVGF